MATTEQRISDNTDPLKSILSILDQFGSGTTTTKSSTESGGPANAQADALMQSIQQSVNPDALAQLVQGILLKAKTAFGPNIASSLGAGNRTVSDSSLAQIQNEAAARATADSAQAILEAQNNAAKLATSIVNTKLNASKNTTQTQRTGITPAGKGIIGLTVGQKTRKLFEGDKETGKAGPTPEQLGYSQDQLANLGGPEQLGFSDQQLTDLGVSSGSSSVTDVIPGGSGVDAPFLDPFNFDSAPIDSGSMSTNTSVDNTPEDTGIQINVGGSQSNNNNFQDPFGPGNSVLFPPPSGSGGGDTTSSPPPEEDTGCFLCWIVCTELHRQGKLPTRWYIPGSRVFAKYDDNIKRGYYFWAIPLSKHLRHSPDSLLSKITTIGCNHRAEFIANRAGIRGARKTFRGFFVIHSLYWACWFLGKVLPKRIQFTEESGYGRTRN